MTHGDESARRYMLLGRRKLEAFVQRLVSEDGSFSQHSVNYHRVFLDTMSMCELWRRALSLHEFSGSFYARVTAAADWLRHFIFSSEGDCPNLGANDGAHLLPFAEERYRDFRPSCQLATILFNNKRAFDDDICDQSARWTHTPVPAATLPAAGSKIFPAGGYAILRKDKCAVLLRFPRRQFRPSHCDALHVDLWVCNEALLRDGGTYSYNDGNDWLEYFSGDAGHNSIQFANMTQMPRIGRFLFGDWLDTEEIEPLIETDNHTSFGAGYVNLEGRRHHRKVTLYADKLIVIDSIDGFSGEALTRWRLCPGDWVLGDGRLTGGFMSIEVVSNTNTPAMAMTQGFESLHYMQKTELPVLNVKTTGPTVLSTTFRWTV